MLRTSDRFRPPSASRRFRVLAVVLLVVLGSCDGPTAPVIGPVLSIEGDHISFSALGQSRSLTFSLVENGRAVQGATPAWRSEDVSVATVGPDGLVRAVASGSTRVVGAYRGATAAITVVVDQLPASIVASPDTARFSTLGDSVRLVVTVLDEGGSPIPDAAPTFTVVDAGVASVSSAGLVRAVGPGATAVLVEADPVVWAVPVVVVQTVSDVVLSVDSIDFDALGDTATISAQLLDAAGFPVDATPEWTSSDTTVVRVSSDGVVTSVGGGLASVQATVDGAGAVAIVTVRQVVATIDLGLDSIVLPDPGDTLRVTPSAYDRLGAVIAEPVITWSSADASVVGVDGAGLMTAAGAGRAHVRASGGSASDSVAVRVLPELTLQVVGSAAPAGAVDESVVISVRVTDLSGTPFGGATVTWAAADGSIASAPTVLSDETGLASATWRFGTTAGPQAATGTVTTRGSDVVRLFEGDAAAGPAETAMLSADSVLLSGARETARLVPTFRDRFGNVASADVVTWGSSDDAVATVEPDGVITGVTAGTAWIRWTLGFSVDSVLVTLVQRGAITVTFDDGWRTTYDNALPVMEEFSLPGNIGVYTEVVGSPAFMDLAQLQDLHDRGWSLVSHTVSHDSLTTLSDADLDYQLRASQQWLVDRGFERGSGVLIAPYHDFGPRERAAAGTYYEAARGVSSNAFVPDSLVHWLPEEPLELTGIDTGQLPFTTSAGRDQLRVLLQRAVDEGRFLDVLFHQVPTQDVDAFRATLAVVDEFRDRVVPYHELFPQTVRVVH